MPVPPAISQATPKAPRAGAVTIAVRSPPGDDKAPSVEDRDGGMLRGHGRVRIERDLRRQRIALGIEESTHQGRSGLVIALPGDQGIAAGRDGKLGSAKSLGSLPSELQVTERCARRFVDSLNGN